MTLEELIDHEEKESKATWNGKTTLCAEEHRQLAEWLKDYKRLKEQEPCEDVPDTNVGDIYECSCGYGWDKSKVVRHHFCPNCGAKMEGE